MTGSGTILVATRPSSHPAADLVPSASRILKKDSYEVGMLLAAKIPRIAARFPDTSTAEQVCSDLRSLGMAAFTIPEAELNLPPHYFRANNVTFEDGGARFTDRSGKSKILTTGEVFLILKGRLSKQVETETKTTSRKLNITGTLLMGGVPVLKKVTKTVKETATEASVFLRIYTRESMDPAAEILRGEINYSSLGPAMAATSAANFEILTGKLREIFPAAIFDDILMEAARPGLASFTPVDVSTIDSRLIYLYHLNLSH